MSITSDKQRLSDSSIADAIASITDIAHLKDAKTQQYLHCNSSTLNCFGLSKLDEIVGYTVKDLDKFMQPHWGNEYANKIEQFDHQVVEQKETVCHHDVTILRSGIICVQTLSKFPVFNQHNQVSSIFTFTQNLTHTLKLPDLFQLYKQHYHTENAIKYFLKYLKLDVLFNVLPTETELLALISNPSFVSLRA